MTGAQPRVVPESLAGQAVDPERSKGPLVIVIDGRTDQEKLSLPHHGRCRYALGGSPPGTRSLIRSNVSVIVVAS